MSSTFDPLLQINGSVLQGGDIIASGCNVVCGTMGANDLVALGWAAPSEALDQAIQQAMPLVALPTCPSHHVGIAAVPSPRKGCKSAPVRVAAISAMCMPCSQLAQHTTLETKGPVQKHTGLSESKLGEAQPGSALQLVGTNHCLPTRLEHPVEEATLSKQNERPPLKFGGSSCQGCHSLLPSPCCGHNDDHFDSNHACLHGKPTTEVPTRTGIKALPWNAHSENPQQSKDAQQDISPLLGSLCGNIQATAAQLTWLLTDLIEIAETSCADGSSGNVNPKKKVAIFFVIGTKVNILGKDKECTLKPGAYEARIMEVCNQTSGWQKSM
jgi:hypothetical protein